MKRILLCCLCCLLLCACHNDSSKASGASPLLYFPSASYNAESALCSLPLNGDISELTAEALTERCLSATPPVGALPMIDKAWSLRKVYTDNATVYFVFQGAAVSEERQSLSCACLAKTLLQLEGIRQVSLTVPGREAPVVLTQNDILLQDTGMLPQEEPLALYFPDAAQRYLVRETQAVEAIATAEKPALILRRLLKSHANSCIPDGTLLLDISVENGVCTVDLSSEFSEAMPKRFASERMAVYSIVNSLTELPEITTVDFWVSGAPLDALYYMDLSAGVRRDETLIAPTVSRDSVDVTLYPVYSSDEKLAAIPQMLQTQSELSLEEQTLDALLNYEGSNGLHRCIPAGTKLLSLRVENGNCIIDLTGEFLGGCTNEVEERRAVRAIIATMCALPKIKSVELLVEGIEPAYRDSALGRLHQANADWLAQ